MKKTVIIVVGLLLCVVGVTVIGQKKNLSPKEERREVREKRRADRIASFEKTMDSVILSRNFQFNPDRKSTRLNSSHKTESRMPSSA